jgi:hypothetical protein
VTEPAEQPRSWLPFIIAGSLAGLVIVGAVVTHLVRADLAPEKEEAVAACEAAYADQFPEGPGIIGGDIYSATEWEGLRATMIRLGYEDDAELTGEESDSRDHAAADLVAAGADEMTIVWQRDDQSHATCLAELENGAVTSTTITELVTSDEASPSPKPSPSSS